MGFSQAMLIGGVWHRDFYDAVIVDAPDEAIIGMSFGDVGDERGIHPVDAFLDLVVEHGTKLRWKTTIANHRPDVLLKLASEDSGPIGFADSGAHLRNMAFYDFGDWQLIGSSPEVMVQAEPAADGVRASLRPIAGTRPRGRTPLEDRELEAELLADPKERAEHVMLVDLGRNDLGRVCQPGSVEVKDLMVIERYSHVMHIVSQVEGRLSPDHDVLDLLMAAFPAGTVSGAPKIRAMQLIHGLEPDARGPYSGVYGSVDLAGALNTAITIRTMVVQPNGTGGCRVKVQAGAGVVADSRPDAEYEETLNKARGMLTALACLNAPDS